MDVGHLSLRTRQWFGDVTTGEPEEAGRTRFFVPEASQLSRDNRALDGLGYNSSVKAGPRFRPSVPAHGGGWQSR